MIKAVRLVAVLFVFVLLTACADSGSSSGTAPAADSSKPADPAKAEASRAHWSYEPTQPESKAALGVLTVKLPPGNLGTGRTYSSETGYVLETSLIGRANLVKSVGGKNLAEALGLPANAFPDQDTAPVYVMKVISDTPAKPAPSMCGDAPMTHVLIYEPDSKTDKTLLFAPISGGPPSATSKVCAVMAFKHK